jgi:hypothetical protein
VKRIPGIKPRFVRCTISRPDGSVLPAWEMFVGERSFGRSNSKEALLRSWEARLEEAEQGKPFAFRPLQKRMQKADRPVGAKHPNLQGVRNGNSKRTSTSSASGGRKARRR